MAGFLIYVPGSTADDGTAELQRLGLSEFLEPSAVAPICTPLQNSGPDGGSGRLITFDMGPTMPDTPRSVDMNTQEWKPAPPDVRHNLEAGRYWLGYVKASRPGPVELQRQQLIDGDWLELADGQRWQVPIADFAPKRLTIDPLTGEEVAITKSAHREFMDEANKIFRHFVSDEFGAALNKEYKITIPGGLSFAGLALQKNYRLNTFAVDLLELVDEIAAVEIAKVATGMSMLARAISQKKN